jgi:hypothetical protein
VRGYSTPISPHWEFSDAVFEQEASDLPTLEQQISKLKRAARCPVPVLAGLHHHYVRI